MCFAPNSPVHSSVKRNKYGVCTVCFSCVVSGVSVLLNVLHTNIHHVQHGERHSSIHTCTLSFFFLDFQTLLIYQKNVSSWMVDKHNIQFNLKLSNNALINNSHHPSFNSTETTQRSPQLGVGRAGPRHRHSHTLCLHLKFHVRLRHQSWGGHGGGTYAKTALFYRLEHHARRSVE